MIGVLKTMPIGESGWVDTSLELMGFQLRPNLQQRNFFATISFQIYFYDTEKYSSVKHSPFISFEAFAHGCQVQLKSLS